jgi:DNA-binding NtrC family response regulator/tetratricopeptide (TPR) repeat protein
MTDRHAWPLLGHSPALRAIAADLERLAPSLAAGRRTPPILLQGETGTGKGLLARAIHQASPRARAPFVDLNCAAIPATLLEAELFGHERGAFTDARQARTGLVQAAHLGTLFLDEIALLPEALQAKLLSVLETREVRPLGRTRAQPVDVLIIAATNADLRAAVREGRFREDLYHRLAVLVFSLPPLRERGPDILTLADVFLGRICADHGLPPRTLTDDARAALLAHPWPGNVRELSNLMERVALLSGETRIDAGDLGLVAPLPDARPGPLGPGGDRPLKASIESFTRARVEEALRAARGNISAAADQLGIPRSTLRYHVDKFGLAPERSGRSSRRAAAEPVEALAPEVPAPAPDPGPLRWERRSVTLLRAMITRPDGAPPTLGGTDDLDSLVERARSLGGQIEDVMPGGVLAAFGVDTVDDAPGRAAHAGIAMCRAIERAHAPQGDGTSVRVAIHVVPVLVGRLADGPRLDLDSKREASTLLEALIERADPGTVVASESALGFLSRRYRLEALAAVGSEAGAVPGYRVLGLDSTGPAARTLTPFVGREREIETLHAILARAEDHAQLVWIVGEPGIGKSRLLRELHEDLRGRDLTWLEGHCASYGAQTPYFAVATLLRRACGILEMDPPEVVAGKLEEHLGRLGMDARAGVPDLLRVLGQEGAIEREPNPKAAQVRTFETLRRLLLNTARARPVVVALEDVHWIDRTSELCWASLTRSLGGSGIMFVATGRPDAAPPWGAAPATQITLQRLGYDESLALVTALLQAPSTAAGVARGILRRAEGNPLFLEELARDAREPGPRAREAELPGTIGAVVQARIDHLPPALRALLVSAATLGADFSAELLETVMGGEPATVRRDLRELNRLGFLEEQAESDETAYRFTHALLQEAAYESLSPSERRDLHARAGRALDRLSASRVGDVDDRLAHHYARSGDTARAVESLTRFAQKAAQSHARAEAIGALHEALSQVERLPAGPERDRLFTDLVLRQRDTLYFLGDLRRGTLEFLLRQRAWVERLDDAAVRSLYFLWLGRMSTPLGEFRLAVESAERAIEEARGLGDALTVASAESVLANAYCWSGRSREGLACGRRAVAHLEGTSERYWLGYAYRGVALNAFEWGDLEGGLDAARRLGEIGDELGESFFQFTAAWSAGLVPLFRGRVDEAIAIFRRVVETAPSPFEIAQASTLLALAHLDAGHGVPAIELLKPLASQPDRLRQRHVHGVCVTYLGEGYRLVGDLERAERAVREGLAATEEAAYPHGIGSARRVLGRIARDRGDRVAAERELRLALEIFGAIPARIESARTTLELGLLRAGGADRPAARATLEEASALCEELGMAPYAARAREAVAELGRLAS